MDRWTKRARERLTMESAACGIGSFEHSGLKGIDSTADVDIRRRSLQILPNTAALCVARSTYPSYLVVHLTDSMTLGARIWWHSTRRFRSFLPPYEPRGPVTILPDALPSSCGLKDASNFRRPPNCMLPLLLQERYRIYKLSCMAYGL